MGGKRFLHDFCSISGRFLHVSGCKSPACLLAWLGGWLVAGWVGGWLGWLVVAWLVGWLVGWLVAPPPSLPIPLAGRYGYDFCMSSAPVSPEAIAVASCWAGCDFWYDFGTMSSQKGSGIWRDPTVGRCLTAAAGRRSSLAKKRAKKKEERRRGGKGKKRKKQRVNLTGGQTRPAGGRELPAGAPRQGPLAGGAKCST